MEWMLLAWRKYIDFSGRARRKEYWMFVLGIIIAGAVASIIDNVIFGWPVLAALLGLAALIPSLACQARRFQDQDKSALFVLLHFLPGIGSLIIFVFMCLPGTPGQNQYGPDPKSGAMV
jgi:uncharacterized membrane protein YhaH (DUF805 family)